MGRGVVSVWGGGGVGRGAGSSDVPCGGCTGLPVCAAFRGLAQLPDRATPGVRPGSPTARADKKIFEQAYSASFGPAMDICYEIYEDVAW